MDGRTFMRNTAYMFIRPNGLGIASHKGHQTYTHRVISEVGIQCRFSLRALQRIHVEGI